MLGWFKKTFGRNKEEQAPAVEITPPSHEVVESATPPVMPPEESSSEAAVPQTLEQETVVAKVAEEESGPVEPEPAQEAVEGPEEAYDQQVVEVEEGEETETAGTAPPDFEQPASDHEQEPTEQAAAALDASAEETAAAPGMQVAGVQEPVCVEGKTVAIDEQEAATSASQSVPVKEDASLEQERSEPAAEAEEATAEAIGQEVDQTDEPATPGPPVQEKPRSLFTRLHERLGKTRDSFIHRLDTLFLGKKQIDQDLFDQLEEILITADLGVGTAMELLDLARKRVKRDQLKDPQALKTVIRDQIFNYLVQSDQPAELVMPREGPFVIMVVGVNGVGKTTSIGKIAKKFVDSGQSVLLVAGDTFRAAAIDQLKIWAERVGIEVVAQKPGADPSSVVFDAMEYGKARGFDVIMIDTAGRLHTSVNLMAELKKVKRVIGKKMEGAPHEVMLVIDSTTGQNGISQARLFNEAVGVTGLTLTKLDGTAKGGIVVNICREIGIPVRFIGIGERMEDLRDFSPGEFVDALFGTDTPSDLNP